MTEMLDAAKLIALWLQKYNIPRDDVRLVLEFRKTRDEHKAHDALRAEMKHYLYHPVEHKGRYVDQMHGLPFELRSPVQAQY